MADEAVKTGDERVSRTGAVVSGEPPLERLQSELSQRYEFHRQIGRGGAAYVYLAHDRSLDRQVALKVLRPEMVAATSETRFIREIKLAAELRHPHIMPLLDSGTAAGLVFYTMPFVEGQTLQERLAEKGALSFDEILRTAGQVASALDHAHEHGVIHRDIKPANILLNADGVLVADFGIARAISAERTDKLTESGVAIGTPEYMSPEQAGGSGKLDSRTDIYSLACVVFEMLSGAPPFSGATPEAILARQCLELPPSLRVVRPTVSEALQRVVERALSKVAADRHDTAASFVHDLEAAIGAPPRRATARTVIAGVAVTALALVAAWLVWSQPASTNPLRPNRVVVFPLRDPGGAPAERAGEGVATYIGYALSPLQWLDGWELMDPSVRDSASRLAVADARRLSRAAGAAHFIDGSVERSADSLVVILRLHSVERDSIISTTATHGSTGASLPKLGLRGIGPFLSLLQPGRTWDFASLADRSAGAIAEFLQAETEYRRMRFTSALEHYKRAIDLDSAFALAAMKGAQAASWIPQPPDDSVLVEVAFRRARDLPEVLQLRARGLRAHVLGSADSALYYYERALVLDPASAAVWTLLGEVHSRMLPSRADADSLARDAFEQARRLDGDFAPALMALEEFAFERGDLAAADRLTAELGRAGADTTHHNERMLMRRCLSNGPHAMSWSTEVQRDPRAVLHVGKVLSRRASQPACARSAFEAILASRQTPSNYRWVAALALHALLSAAADTVGMNGVFLLPGTTDLPRWSLDLMAATAGAGFAQRAARAVDSLGTDYKRLDTRRLWIIGSFEASRGNRAAVTTIAEVTRARADVSRQRRDRLVADIMRANSVLLSGDTVAALRLLQALRPTGRRDEITWDPWESLGNERFLAAQLLFARGQGAPAMETASLLDASEPVSYLYYLRPSLELRARIARASRDETALKNVERRLRQLHAGGSSRG